MNTTHPNSFPWSADLAESRDVSPPDKAGFEMILGWFEKWRIGKSTTPGRDAATRLWREQVTTMPREAWQLQHWAEPYRRYLRWLHFSNAKVKEITNRE